MQRCVVSLVLSLGGLSLGCLSLGLFAGCEAAGPAAGAAAPTPPQAVRAGAAPVTITSDPTGASITIDGAIVGEAPLTITLNPGPHRLRATKSGYYPAPETRFQVSRDTPMTHQVTLVASH